MSSKVSTRHKLTYWILSVIFLMFAYVQLNDPDPAIWFSIYLMIAVFFGFSNFYPVPNILLYSAVIGLLIFSVFHFNYFYEWIRSNEKSELFGEMVYDKPYIEGTKEFLGLFLAIGSLLYLLRSKHD